MVRRLIGVALLALLIAGVVAGPAFAVEEEEGGTPAYRGELPSIDELGTQSEVARQFFPEAADPAPFTAALVYPLLAVGFLAVLIILTLYLKWQPSFSEEEKSRRR